MSRSFHLSPVRSASIILAALCLGQEAAAQAYNPANDPLVQRVINHGEQMVPFGSDRDLNVYDSRWGTFGRPVSLTLYLPPRPPALGEELPVAVSAGFERAPAADLNRETFYGGYAILEGRNQLPAKDTERVAAYRGARLQLLREMRAKFAELADATPAARTAALADLATRQNGRLRALAGEAEAIRDDLAWVGSSYEFNLAIRSGAVRYDGPSGQTLRLYFAAYFDAGLSTEQRQLLPEIAYDVRAGAKGEDREPSGDRRDYFSFLPATARLRLPADLPAPLAAKIQAFTREKESLKSELRSAVLEGYYFFSRWQTKRYAALAEQQAPRFAALETLAEEIRAGLAGFRYPDQPSPPALPADLTQRVGSFTVRKMEVQRELLNRLRNLAGEIPGARFAIERQGDGLAIVQTAAGRKSAAGLAEFNASLARRYTALAGESESLRRDIQRYTETGPNRAARTVDQLAADFAKAYAAQENWNRYGDYSRAVLEPGLSSPQRQLLFQAATAALEHTGRLQP